MQNALHWMDGNAVKIVLHTEPLPPLPENIDVDATDVFVVINGNWKACGTLSN